MLDWLLLTKRPQNIADMIPWSKKSWPGNIWLGTTVENQHWAEIRLPELLQHNAKVRFLSCEPLLGAINLKPWFSKKGIAGIDWVIAGGESGPYSRPMHPAWVRDLRDQCKEHGAAFHFKQWGHWVPSALLTKQQKKVVTIGETEMVAAGKKMAGRFLDGRTWDEFPKVA
jgi:protein gp37